MASAQIMSEALAEATRETLQTVAEAWAEKMHSGSGPKVGSPTMRQPTFDWNAQDKYSELKTFCLEVKQYYFNLQHPTNRQIGTSQKLVR